LQNSNKIKTVMNKDTQAVKTGVELIAEERKRQIEIEGWDKKHDSLHSHGQMIGAAACYAVNALNKSHTSDFARVQIYGIPEPQETLHGVKYPTKGEWVDAWPWDKRWDKREKHDAIRSLTIAGALIAAELDRLNKKSI
jgi:hypothetical protein